MNRPSDGAGEISFEGDQKCREKGNKTGHRSGPTGDDPAVLLLVQPLVRNPERRSDGVGLGP
jgi:hypothetical protein